MTGSQIKLTYFNGAGRAELSRLIFTFGGVAFEDERVDGQAFGAMKPTLPLGQLPVVHVDGTTYGQSMAIARFAGKRAGLYPEDAVAALRVDMICETFVELTNAFIAIMFGEKDDAKKAEKYKTFATETAAKALAALEKLVRGKFFAGDSASIADIQLFDFVTNGAGPNVPDFSMVAYPKLESVVANVKANANVAAYLAKHQK